MGLSSKDGLSQIAEREIGIIVKDESIQAFNEFAGRVFLIVVEVKSFEALVEGFCVSFAERKDRLALHLVYFALLIYKRRVQQYLISAYCP